MLSFAFFLGVVFITFNMLWGVFTFVLKAFLGKLGNTEKYILRITQAYFMASMTAIATKEYSLNNLVNQNVLIATGVVVLFLYLVSKIEQRKKMIEFNFQFNKNKIEFSKDSLKYDIVIAVFTVLFYVICILNSFLVQNIANDWFFKTIQAIYKTPVIGWIIGLIGVFFIVSIFIKGIVALQIIFNQIKNNDNDDDGFSDYEVIEDESKLIE